MESRVFGVLDVAVPLGFAFQGVASKLGFRDKSQLKWRFWWMGVCSERVEIIPHVWCGVVCPTRVSYKSVLQECPTRVSYKSVIWTYVVFRTCLHSGSWVPSCL